MMMPPRTPRLPVWHSWQLLLALATGLGAMIAFVDRFNDHDRVMRERLSVLEATVHPLAYAFCVQLRRTDPAAMPPVCNDPALMRLR